MYLLLLSFLSCAALAQSVGTFTAVSGTVTVKAAGTATKAQVGTEIPEKATITTAQNSLAEWHMVDGATFKMREGSTVELPIYNFNKQTSKGNVYVRLLIGALRSVTGLIGKTDPNSISYVTSSATVGVRGTDHEMIFIPQKGWSGAKNHKPGTYDQVYEGNVVIINTMGEVKVGPGQAGFAPLNPNIPPQLTEFILQAAITNQLLHEIGKGGGLSATDGSGYNLAGPKMDSADKFIKNNEGLARDIMLLNADQIRQYRDQQKHLPGFGQEKLPGFSNQAPLTGGGTNNSANSASGETSENSEENTSR